MGALSTGRGYYSANDVQLVRISPAGELTLSPLVAEVDLASGVGSMQWAPQLTPGADAAVWAVVASATLTRTVDTLVRAGEVAQPPAVVPPTYARRVIARRGGLVWLQLGCDLPPGRYCRGSVALWRGPRRASGSGRFAIPGGQARPVALRLGAAERRSLRAARPLRLLAQVTTDGVGETSRSLTLR